MLKLMFRYFNNESCDYNIENEYRLGAKKKL